MIMGTQQGQSRGNQTSVVQAGAAGCLEGGCPGVEQGH